ncbi:hypothetical protein [Scytonema sp. NUACC26]|uniref:hypothetical protein n=1 Tax=Scytonema sp. NUACC26 TaxID=3140176 RepID=UPI0034DC4F4A
MTTIIPGNNGTLKTTTVEGQLLELMAFLQVKEVDTTVNPSGKDYIQGNFNFNTFAFNGTFNIPVTQTIGSNGELTLVAKEYLVTSGFDPGSSGTFKSTNPAQYLIEIITYIQTRENDPTKNLSGNSIVTASIDTDAMTYSGTVNNLPVLMTIDGNGNTVFSAKEYLS